MAILRIPEKKIAMQLFFFSPPHCTQPVLQMLLVPQIQNEYCLGVGSDISISMRKQCLLWRCSACELWTFCGIPRLHIPVPARSCHQPWLEIQPSHKKVPSLLTAGRLWLSSLFSFPFLEGQWLKETQISHHFWTFFYYIDKPVAFITEILPRYAKQPLSS